MSGFQHVANVCLLVTKTGSRWVPYDVYAESTEPMPSFAEYPVDEDLQLIGTEQITLPDEVTNMPDTKQAKITAELWTEWTRDYFGEYDAESELRNCKVMLSYIDSWYVRAWNWICRK